MGIAAVLLFDARRDDLTLGYNLIKREIGQQVFGIQLESATPQYAKDLPLQELKHMLVSTSQSLRATAIQAIGERGELTLVPTLIKLLNDDSSLRELPTRMPPSVALLAKQSLTNILRLRISKDPANISVLIPFFEAATRGTSQERKHCVDILGAINEPLGLPLLSQIAESDEDNGVRASARVAFDRIAGVRTDADFYLTTRRTQLHVIIVMFGTVVVLLGFMLRRLFRGGEARFGVLALVPIVLCGGLGSLTTIDHFRGEIDKGSVSRSVARHDGMALRTMLYQDYTEYPGDSGIARYLVQIGNEDVIRTLLLIPSIEPDDLDHMKQSVEKRTQWLLARIVVSQLDSPKLFALARSNDRGVRLAFVKTADALSVTNPRIVEILTTLTSDSDAEISEKARVALERTKKYTMWQNR